MAGGQTRETGNSHGVKGLTRNKPWLLPSNRKLRHLQGISLRNIELSKPPLRPKNKTIDDESLPNALKTPAKALAQKENRQLEHSRSSGDLKLETVRIVERGSGVENSLKAKSPLGNKLRRSSTLNWTNAAPRVRQQTLQSVMAEKMADTWFSLHVDRIEEPIYVSEVIEQTRNPSFRFFDLNTHGAFVTRRDELVVKIWARTKERRDFILLIELSVNLRSLQYVGKTLDSFHHPLPQTAVLFHLTDGIYTSFIDLPLDETVRVAPVKSKAKQPQHIESTSSFDALMRLSNLDDCIQDALSTREKLVQQITDLLEEQQGSRDTLNAASQAEESLASTNRALFACRKQFQSAQSRCSDLRARLAARRAAMQNGRMSQQEAANLLRSPSSQLELSALKQSRQTAQIELRGQIRRIGEDLSSIYPIQPLSLGSLSFDVRSLRLPNAGSGAGGSKHPTEEETAAALGHAAHLTHLLSYYLSTPLPYPLTPHSSTSTVFDPISTSLPPISFPSLNAARTFPLYQKGAVGYRYEYGVFLLNCNIERLMGGLGARVLDLRHTAGNLKYVITVITEGRGEVPGRKKGVVKGLLGNGGVKSERSRDSSVGSSVKGKTLATAAGGKFLQAGE